jgi:hypothetical protein
MKTMKGVYIHYWLGGAATMIFASESNAEPTDQYSSHSNPGKALINEVLDKLKANNNNPSTPIKLRIVNDTFIVAENESPGATGAAPLAMAGPPGGSRGLVEDDESDADEITPPKKSAAKAKPAAPKPAAKKSTGKKAANTRRSTKKPAAPTSTPRKRKR